ncbi:hypothetical protein TNCV_2516601 [Trichonephila clavipes]|nr:hypothetical protein TNCV_2516601 [Trichonephila clavipes]
MVSTRQKPASIKIEIRRSTNLTCFQIANRLNTSQSGLLISESTNPFTPSAIPHIIQSSSVRSRKNSFGQATINPSPRTKHLILIVMVLNNKGGADRFRGLSSSWALLCPHNPPNTARND